MTPQKSGVCVYCDRPTTVNNQSWKSTKNGYVLLKQTFICMDCCNKQVDEITESMRMQQEYGQPQDYRKHLCQPPSSTT